MAMQREGDTVEQLPVDMQMLPLECECALMSSYCFKNSLEKNMSVLTEAYIKLQKGDRRAICHWRLAS